MRVRFVFWLLLLLTCISVLTFAISIRRDVPALIQLSLDQPDPKVQQVVTLSLHLTDSGGVPVDNASVISDINMTTMDMGENYRRLTSLGQGKYTTQLQFSMAGRWYIAVTTHRDGLIRAQQHLFIEVT